jgi:hypothetical protein
MPKEQIDEVVEVIGGEVRKEMDKYIDFLQKTVSSYPLGDTELGGRAKDCAEKNIFIARDYMHKLSRANNFLEAVPIHTEFMQSQLQLLGEQIKGLGESDPRQSFCLLMLGELVFRPKLHSSGLIANPALHGPTKDQMALELGQGETLTAIAKSYNVSHMTICRLQV